MATKSPIWLFLLILSHGHSQSLDGCRELTYTSCTYKPNENLIDGCEAETQEACQTFCANGAEGCTNYIYFPKLKECNAYSGELKLETAYCRYVAGAPKPSIQTCLSVQNECQGFMQYDCNYKGWMIASMTVYSASACQNTCRGTYGCGYFVFDTVTLNCDLRITGERKCDFSQGRPGPSLEHCLPQTN